MRRARRFPHARRLLPRSQTGAPVQPCDLSICPPFRLFIAADDRLPESCGTSQDNVIWLKVRRRGESADIGQLRAFLDLHFLNINYLILHLYAAEMQDLNWYLKNGKTGRGERG